MVEGKRERNKGFKDSEKERVQGFEDSEKRRVQGFEDSRGQVVLLESFFQNQKSQGQRIPQPNKPEKLNKTDNYEH